MISAKAPGYNAHGHCLGQVIQATEWQLQRKEWAADQAVLAVVVVGVPSPLHLPRICYLAILVMQFPHLQTRMHKI